MMLVKQRIAEQFAEVFLVRSFLRRGVGSILLPGFIYSIITLRQVFQVPDIIYTFKHFFLYTFANIRPHGRAMFGTFLFAGIYLQSHNPFIGFRKISYRFATAIEHIEPWHLLKRTSHCMLQIAGWLDHLQFKLLDTAFTVHLLHCHMNPFIHFVRTEPAVVYL